MKNYSVSHITKNIQADISLPSSKSISNRALILNHFYELNIDLQNLSEADDTAIMLNALKQNAGIINLKNAGTCMRFLTAYFACKENCEVELHGDERMQKRPIKILVDALKELGADITYLNEEGFPPLKIKGKKLSGGTISINADISSQFISALMLVAPSFESGLNIKLNGEIFSHSYIEMTAKLMIKFGFDVSFNGSELAIIKSSNHQIIHSLTHSLTHSFTVEPDWSAASYWYEIAALSNSCNILLKGLHTESLQGDEIISDLMNDFGVETIHHDEGILLQKNHQIIKTNVTSSDLEKHQINLASTPDLLPALAVTAAVKNSSAKFTGLKNLRIKESDRLNALETELKKCGFDVMIEKDTLKINPVFNFQFSSFNFNTYNDHRMAMAFAPLALIFDKVEVENADVVEKSYPQFWNDLKQAGFEISLANKINQLFSIENLII